MNRAYLKFAITGMIALNWCALDARAGDRPAAHRGRGPRISRVSEVVDSHSGDPHVAGPANPTFRSILVPSLGQLGSPLVPIAADHPGVSGAYGYLPGFQFGHPDPSLTHPDDFWGHGVGIPKDRSNQGEPPQSIARDAAQHLTLLTHPQIVLAAATFSKELDALEADPGLRGTSPLAQALREAVHADDVRLSADHPLRRVKSETPTTKPTK